MELGQIMISEYLVGENDTIADALKRIVKQENAAYL